jgi:hypothetical protein
MSYHEHPRLRLEIDHEAEALMLNLGAEAYSVARQRAEEASSEWLPRLAAERRSAGRYCPT